MGEQQASAETEVVEGSAAPEKAAPDSETDITEQHKQLLDKHAQLGREAKQEREARVKAEARATELEAERDKLAYEQMSDEKKAEFRLEKERQSKELPKTANLRNEKDLLRTIAETDDPKITKALSALYWRSEERGVFPDKDTVEAFVEGMLPDDEEEVVEPKTKAPPNVTPMAGTRGKELTVDEEIDVISKSIKAKDGKFAYGDLLSARQRRDAQRAAASRE